MLVDDVLYHFLNVALSGSASQGIADAKYMINNGYQMLGFTAMGGVKVRF